jgi:hypothetical protein
MPKARASGRDGSFPDKDSIALASNAPTFEVTASLPAKGLRTATSPKQPDACRKHSLLVSADRSVRVATDGSDEAILVRPYQLVRLPVALTPPADADQPVTLRVQVALDESLVDQVRNMERRRTSFFVYGLLAEPCTIVNPSPREK